MGSRARIGWVVDVQNDFMQPEGRLYVKDLEDPSDEGAVRARGTIEAAAAWMREHCDVMVFTGDWHGYGDAEIDPHDPDPEEGTYPPHCMGRSRDPDERRGAQIIDSLRPESPVILEIGASEGRAKAVARIAVEEDRPVFIHKNRFNVFEGNKATDGFLKGLREILDAELEFYVAGVARDVCVTGAVDGLQERGYATVALEDATWGLGLEPEEDTLRRWADGGRVMSVSELRGVTEATPSS